MVGASGRFDVSVVVPTLREAQNIAALAGQVAQAMAPTGLRWEMVVVDDDSGDGIEEPVAALAETLPVRLLVRAGQRRSLSLSVIMGIERCGADRVVVMDADRSHPPSSIPAMLAALDGVDMVVGSRYAAGGEIDVDWGWHRRAVSRIGTLLARPLVACTDPLSGFFALDRRAVPDLAGLKPIGYKIGLELMVRGRLRLGEVPIAFRDRESGRSKFNLTEQLRFIRHLVRLYRDALIRHLMRLCRDALIRRAGRGGGRDRRLR